MMVRGVSHGNGWKAWSKLLNRCGPKTPARALLAMTSGMSPKNVKDVRDLPQAVEEWEISMNNLKLEHDVEINNQIKTALLTSMAPADLQDYIFQWAEVHVGYERAKDRVVSRKEPSKGGGKGRQKGEYGWWSSRSGGRSAKAGETGKGKSIVGDCWNCGESGHRVSQGPKKGSTMAIGGAEQHDEDTLEELG